MTVQVVTQVPWAQGSAFSLNSHLSARFQQLSCSVGSHRTMNNSTTELFCGLPQFIASCVFSSSSVIWQEWLLFSWGLFHLQLLTVMRRKPGQSISSMPLLQPLPDLSLPCSTQGKAHVCTAPGLFLTAVFICLSYERHL